MLGPSDSGYSRLPSEMLDLQPFLHGFLDFWSEPTSATVFTVTPIDKPLGNVVIPDISGLEPIKAYALMSISFASNTSGSVNYLSTDQYIQVNESSAGWINSIKLLANQYEMPANSRFLPGEVVVGSYDISSLADVNKTVNFQWASARSLSSSLHFAGIRTGVRLVF